MKKEQADKPRRRRKKDEQILRIEELEKIMIIPMGEG